MADVKWIKIRTDIFDNRKIRQLEVLPEGDSIIVIWYKLLCLAGSINDGGAVYFTKDIPYTEDMLATAFCRPINTIKLALRTFEKFEMIEIFEEIIYVSNWEKYQSIEGLEKIREQTRNRVQKHRENIRKNGCNVTGNATVTLGNATDIDKELELEEDKEKEKELLNILSFSEDKSSGKTTIYTDTQRIFDFWNSKKIQVHRYMTSDIENAIKKAIEIYGVEGVLKGIENYATILFDKNYFFKYKWSLKDFLKREKGIVDFLTSGDKWINYIESKSGKKQAEQTILKNINVEELLNDFR